MCSYVLLANMCGCYGPLVCQRSCVAVLQELDRINQPEAWDDQGLRELLFRLPDRCLPGWHNTTAMDSGVFCNRYRAPCPSLVTPQWPFLDAQARNQSRF